MFAEFRCPLCQEEIAMDLELKNAVQTANPGWSSTRLKWYVTCHECDHEFPVVRDVENKKRKPR